MRHSSAHADDVDEAILDRAAALLEGGGLTMAALAREAGIARATLYRRFPGRDAVLHALQARDGGDPLKAAPSIRERILDAVGEVAMERGLAGATIERIAERAEVGPATVYRHFGDKMALLRAFADTRSPRVAARRLAEAGGDDVEAELLAFAREALRFASSNQGMWRLAFAPGEASRALLSKVHRGSETSRRMLAAYLQRQMDAGHLRAADPLALAVAFSGMVMGFALIVPTMEGTPPPPVEPTARLIVQLFLRGARGAAPATPRNTKKGADHA